MGTKRGKGTKIMAVADQSGLPVAVYIESASPHEVKLVDSTLVQMVIPEAPQNLIAISPDARSAKLEYVDTSGDYDKKFYYIDLVQADGKKAISSPIWTN